MNIVFDTWWQVAAAGVVWWIVGAAVFLLFMYRKFRELTAGDLWLSVLFGVAGPVNIIVFLLVAFIDFCCGQNRRIL